MHTNKKYSVCYNICRSHKRYFLRIAEFHFYGINIRKNGWIKHRVIVIICTDFEFLLESFTEFISPVGCSGVFIYKEKKVLHFSRINYMF